MTSRQRDQMFPIGIRERTCTDEQRACPVLDERCEGCFDVAVVADIDNDELLPNRTRCGLYVASLRLGIRARVH
jgi:hypothetical protein